MCGRIRLPGSIVKKLSFFPANYMYCEDDTNASILYTKVTPCVENTEEEGSSSLYHTACMLKFIRKL